MLGFFLMLCGCCVASGEWIWLGDRVGLIVMRATIWLLSSWAAKILGFFLMLCGCCVGSGDCLGASVFAAFDGMMFFEWIEFGGLMCLALTGAEDNEFMVFKDIFLLVFFVPRASLFIDVGAMVPIVSSFVELLRIIVVAEVPFLL